jgi:hypothetical protein
MGNEVARHEDPVDASREGVMPRFTFTETTTETTPGHWQITKAEALPTWVDLTPKIRIVELSRALADRATPAPQRAVYQAGSASTYAAAGPAWPACPWPGAERGRELNGGDLAGCGAPGYRWPPQRYGARVKGPARSPVYRDADLLADSERSTWAAVPAPGGLH